MNAGRTRSLFAKGPGLRAGPSEETLTEEDGEDESALLLRHGSSAMPTSPASGTQGTSNGKWVLSTVVLGCLANLVAAHDADLPLCDAKPNVGRDVFILGSVMAWASGLLYFYSRCGFLS